MSWSQLKADIAQWIKTNGNQEITGAILQNELFRLIDNMGALRGYMGKATPSGDPGTQDGNVFYFAEEAGTYLNYGGVEITTADGLYVISQINSVWSVERVLFTGFNEADITETIRKTLNPGSYSVYLPDGSPYTTPSIPGATPTKVVIPASAKSINDFEVIDVGLPTESLKYIGSSAQTFKLLFSTSMATGTNNVLFKLMMYKNGVPEPGAAISRKIATGGDVGAVAGITEFICSPNDILEIFAEVDLTSTVTFSLLNIIITEKN